jgi:predicted AlkP superfamily pyrophosphatase or phosphodiesterase
MTVILVTLDGVRPDAIQQANTPILDKFITEGASTMLAQSMMPSITLPCHMSIFHSVPPERHGILENVYHPMARPLPGLFEQVHQAGKRSASFYNWEPLRDLSRPGSLNYSFFKAEDYYDIEHTDHVTVQAAVPLIERDEYEFIFLYLGATDLIGHRDGWMSEGYLKQVEIADSLLGEVMQVLPPNSHILIEADHGGHERNHGTDLPEDITIPWIVWGKTIRQSYSIEQRVSLLDTAPTLAHILGVKPAQQWEGHVIEEIFLQDK